jgi:type III secretion protein R
VAVLAGMGLAALAFLMVSSFVKIAVVLSILRSALGLSQIPPTSVITGIALVLSLYVMAPTGRAMSVHLGPALEALSGPGGKRDAKAKERLEKAASGLNRAKEPLRAFLSKHAHAEDVRLFHRLALRMNRSDKNYKVGKKSFMVLLPAFLTSELKEAFQIGFLLFIPFLVIDLLVANVLMALGMHMLSPTTISLPFKLLLFVMVDGWHLLTRALLTGYI